MSNDRPRRHVDSTLMAWTWPCMYQISDDEEPHSSTTLRSPLFQPITARRPPLSTSRTHGNFQSPTPSGTRAVQCWFGSPFQTHKLPQPTFVFDSCHSHNNIHIAVIFLFKIHSILVSILIRSNLPSVASLQCMNCTIIKSIYIASYADAL